MVQLANGGDPWKIIVDAFGVAGQIVAQLEEQGVEVHRVTRWRSTRKRLEC